MSEPANGGAARRRGAGMGRDRGERAMVPPAHFTSYYGRPVVKPSPWEADIPAYFFLGGLAAASSMLGAGADLTGRAALRRSAHLSALGAVGLSFAALVHDLGRPERFINMFRVAKPTSPMSVGTWLLSGYAPLAGMAAAGELARWAPPALRGPVVATARPAGLAAALLGGGIATYTAVLLGDTATPSWHDAHGELPFVFAGSAATAAAGLALVAVPVAETAPARRLAVGGAILELAVEQRMERVMGITAEPLHAGRAGRLMGAGKLLTAGGAVLGLAAAGRSRALAVVAGAALLGGSVCTRFGIFEAGQASARDPRYTMVPQRQRMRTLSGSPAGGAGRH